MIIHIQLNCFFKKNKKQKQLTNIKKKTFKKKENTHEKFFLCYLKKSKYYSFMKTNESNIICEANCFTINQVIISDLL